MSRIKTYIWGLILALAVFLAIPTPAMAQGAEADSGTSTASECDDATWFMDVNCVIAGFMKAAEVGALNKQVGDAGTSTIAQVQLLVGFRGLCDAAYPDCPIGLSYQKSALAGMARSTLAMYQHPPARSSEYIADVGRTLGFIPRKAEAQGIGFSGLQSMLPLWKTFRNIAYALLAAIIIVVGFMVMFRKKIDPKTVVTVQNAIPRIVIALGLVTFSYAIVGAMIDLMYLAIVLSASAVDSASGGNLGKLLSLATTLNIDLLPPSFTAGSTTSDPENATGLLLNGGISGLLRFFFASGFQAYDDIGTMITQNDPLQVAGWTVVPGVIGYMFGLRGALLGLTSGPVLLAVIFLIILLFGVIRLIFMLLDAYINIIIALLTAPFQLMMEAIPGTNAFNSWFRNLLSKILVFPITLLLLLITAVLTSQDNATSIWAPPLLSTGEGTYGMAGLIGLGMLMVIPTIVAGLQKSLKAEPVVPGGIGPIVGPLGSGVGTLFNLGYQASFIASAFRHKPEARSPMQIAREGADKGLSSITGGGGH